MADDGRDWRAARRALDRLRAWLPPRQAEGGGGHGQGDALDALSDVGLLRRLLDEAELAAVRAARRDGRSWAEIATRLGVTRQSAWERWRDLDEEPVEPAEPAAAHVAAAHASAAEEAVHLLRRRSTVVVPDVVGLSWDRARDVLRERRLVAQCDAPDGPPLTETGWPAGVVTDQSPESGARVPPGSAVRLWLDRGGGSGVREPRRPKPSPWQAREYRDEPTDEAVG